MNRFDDVRPARRTRSPGRRSVLNLRQPRSYQGLESLAAGLETRSSVRAMTFTRITADADRMGGLPCVRGLRFPVASVVAMVADGMTVDEILSEHPDLEAEDIAECLRYAALAVQERELPLRHSA